MSGLFGTPKTQAVTPPAAAPVPIENDQLKRQQMRRQAAMTGSTGRDSTMLTANTDKLGG